MKKITVILIIAFLVTGFGGLVFYGLRYSRGVPAAQEDKTRQALEVPFMEEEIDLAGGISARIWQGLPALEAELVYQVTVLPWPQKGLISPIVVKAFHNKKDIYFYISWPDDTEDYVLAPNKFSDACAVMFSLGEKAETKPSALLMGFLTRANIWHWKASVDREFWLKSSNEDRVYVDFYYPFEDEETLVVSKDIPQSAVKDLLAVRVGTVTPKENQRVRGRGVWNAGRWDVVFCRSLKPEDTELDAVFPPGKKRYCAFAVWNGSKGDRGGRKAISDWVEMRIE